MIAHWKPTLLLMAVAALLTGPGCQRPRSLALSDQKYERLADDDKVDVYVGDVQQPHEELAIIETASTGWVDDEIKRHWIEELQAKARAMGGNAIQETRILTKRIAGFVPDERTPFASVRQGRTEYYFMRAKVIRIKESEPTSLADARPLRGWEVERLAVPPRLPGLRDAPVAAPAPAPAPPPPPPPAAPAPEATPRPGVMLDEPTAKDLPPPPAAGTPAAPGLPGTPAK
jgi:hypothetical protein